jgi:hypothetical protein
MSNFSEENLTFDLQTICDQQVNRSFNNPPSVSIPQIGSIVLRSIGFGVVTMLGFNPIEAEIGDIAIRISHNGFTSRVTIWLKISNGSTRWHTIAQLEQQFHFTTYLA